MKFVAFPRSIHSSGEWNQKKRQQNEDDEVEVDEKRNDQMHNEKNKWRYYDFQLEPFEPHTHARNVNRVKSATKTERNH